MASGELDLNQTKPKRRNTQGAWGLKHSQMKDDKRDEKENWMFVLTKPKRLFTQGTWGPTHSDKKQNGLPNLELENINLYTRKRSPLFTQGGWGLKHLEKKHKERDVSDIVEPFSIAQKRLFTQGSWGLKHSETKRLFTTGTWSPNHSNQSKEEQKRRHFQKPFSKSSVYWGKEDIGELLRVLKGDQQLTTRSVPLWI